MNLSALDSLLFGIELTEEQKSSQFVAIGELMNTLGNLTPKTSTSMLQSTQTFEISHQLRGKLWKHLCVNKILINDIGNVSSNAKCHFKQLNSYMIDHLKKLKATECNKTSDFPGGERPDRPPKRSANFEEDRTARRPAKRSKTRGKSRLWIILLTNESLAMTSR